jgi:hypothetical protein
MADPTRRDQVFISYSHKDRTILEQLQITLRPLVSDKKISVWDDARIKSGDVWREQIQDALASAKVAVLLVSPDYLASDFVAEHELPSLLEAARKEGLRILWIAARFSMYQETEIARYQALNDPARPLASLSVAQRRKELVRICEGINSAALSVADLHYFPNTETANVSVRGNVDEYDDRPRSGRRDDKDDRAGSGRSDDEGERPGSKRSPVRPTSPKPPRRRNKRVPAPATSPTAPINLTAYYQTEIKPGVWYSLLAYAHVPSASGIVEADSRLRMDQKESKKSSGITKADVKRGAEITVIPEMSGCRFNPTRATFAWMEDWHRVEFRMQAGPEQLGFKYGNTANGRLSFYVGPLLIGEIGIWAHYSENVEASRPDFPSERRTVNPYDAVFVSYSHDDSRIVEGLEKAYSALGIKYLRDIRILRSGEEWNPALLRKIDEANIFQLCWSGAAKRSQYVEQEWRHALGLNRQNFIRPTYWEQPIPEPPEELSTIHFAFVDLKN